MKHYGDITKLKGAELPIVDIVTGGSPCQDLSIAGRRDGLSGERSGLFMEQIRVIKELRDECKRQLSMRGSDDIVRPRYMVWENVPGAFSSNKGEDFRIVLEETARIVEETAVIPEPPRGGWSKSGCIMGDGWSIAWRVHDAQFWGVPQRRKRIALVADFGGSSAPEILFERESLSGDFEQSEQEREEAAGAVGESIEATNGCLNGWDYQSKRIFDVNGVCATLNSGDKEVGNITPSVLDYCLDQQAINTAQGGQRQLCVCIGNGQTNQSISETAGAINCMHDQMAVMTMQAIGEYKQCETASSLKRRDYKDATDLVIAAVDCRNGTENQNINGTLQAKSTGGTGTNFQNVCCVGSVVRRLTPLECERLQGYPTIREVRCSEMTKDEYIAWNISEGNIIVDTERGKVFRTRGQRGTKLDEPKEMNGSNVNGYLCVSIRNGDTKISCRVHRIVWIAAHGIIPDGYVIDHINNNKQDNRIENLQMLTPEENSHKARKDGLYLTQENSHSAKISDEVHDLIQYIYGNSEISIRQLSEMFGISKSRVHQIIHDKGWTDIGEWIDTKGKKHKEADSPRYKALGNSIALPFWQWMAERMVKQLQADGVEDPTMASLFDGIGGFPLVFQRCGAEPVWASEVESFPIAVTKKHFPEGGENEEK